MNDSPTRNHPSNGFRHRHRSASMNSYPTNTPAVTSLSFIEPVDLSFDLNSNSPSHEKLLHWKRTIEQQLHRIYYRKLREINDLIDCGQVNISIDFVQTDLVDPVITVMSNGKPTDHQLSCVDIQWKDAGQCFHHLSSNNVLLCASDEHALIYEDNRSMLILFTPNKIFDSFDWDQNEHGQICDLSYSFYLKTYLIITHFGLFLWSYQESKRPKRVDAIKPISGNRLWSIASTTNRSDTFIVYTLGKFVEHWKSNTDCSLWERVQRWSNYELFDRSDQRIRSIAMTSAFVVWTVETTTNNRWRIDIFDYELRPIRPAVEIDPFDRSSSILLSNYSYEKFLIIDSNRHSLFLYNIEGFIQLKSDPIINERLRHAVILENRQNKWLVLRLQKPNQLCFFPLDN